jgi:hypothetical protein
MAPNSDAFYFAGDTSYFGAKGDKSVVGLYVA